MGEFNATIPIGFRFDPTDEELIRGFLLPKLMGLQLPWNGVVEKELYGDNAAPWAVFGGADDTSIWHTKREGGATKSTTYVFTTLTKVSNSKRISRRAGCGTWSGQTGPKNIKNSDTGAIIGQTRMLSFQYSKSDATSSDLGHWIMHEYSLHDDLVRMTGQTNGGALVLCKITKCIKDSGGHGAVPKPQFFPAALDNGGGFDDIRVPAIAATNIKRAAEEYCPDQEVETGCKKLKLCGGEGGCEGFSGAAAEGCVVVGDESRLVPQLEFDDYIDIDSLFNYADFDSNVGMESLKGF